MKNKKMPMYIALFFSVIVLISSVILSETLTGFISCLVLTIGCILFSVGIVISVYFEFSTAIYECKNCKHRFKVGFSPFIFSMHMGTTRKLICPSCRKKTWCKNKCNDN